MMNLGDNYVTGDNIYLRELQNFFFEVLGMMSITHYGAIGDGRTDNYGPIQVAIDDAHRRGISFLYVPYGRFIYTGELINIGDIIFIGNPHAHIVNIRTHEEIEIKQFGFYKVDAGDEYYTKFETDSRFVGIAGDTMTGSLAIGNSNTATGNLSFASGRDCEATGNESFASGEGCKATASYCFAQGWKCEANANEAHAEGQKCVANGQGSHAEGDFTEATKYAAHSEGYKTSAKGLYSHAEGSSTTATGNASHAEGYQTEATGASSHAEGNTNTASGSSSHAEGYQCTATGTTAHAEGHSSTASGSFSHAEGHRCTASGTYSHAEGNGSSATNQSAHAQGGYTEASGLNSFSSGSHTKAKGYCQTALGSYNIEEGNPGGYNASTNPLLIIGNGQSDAGRSNCAKVLKSGDAWFNGDVYVGSTSGKDMDSGSKKLATEEFVRNQASCITCITTYSDLSTACTASLTQSAKVGDGLSISTSPLGVTHINVGSGISYIRVSAQVVFAAFANVVGTRILRIRKNGSTSLAAGEVHVYDQGSGSASIPDKLVQVTSGDTITIELMGEVGDVVDTSESYITVTVAG